MRTICKGCGKLVYVDQHMVKFKRCKNCIREHLKELLRWKEAYLKNHLPREIIYGIYENEIADLKRRIEKIRV